MRYSQIAWLVAAIAMMLCFGACKTSADTQKQEPPAVEEEEDMGTTPEDQGVVEMSPDEEMAMIVKMEQVPAAERTFRDDMFLVCHAPARVDAEVTGEERVRELSTYISNNIYTPEAVEFFQDMGTMSVESRDAFFEKTINDLGLTTCPFLEESRRKQAEQAEVVEVDERMPEPEGTGGMGVPSGDQAP